MSLSLCITLIEYSISQLGLLMPDLGTLFQATRQVNKRISELNSPVKGCGTNSLSKYYVSTNRKLASVCCWKAKVVA